MISRKFYHLPTPNIDWDIAHIYEHTVIRDFYRYIQEHGYHPSLYGWIRGEAFEGHIFLDTGFYSPKVAELFEDYLQGTHHLVGTRALEQSILDTQAEDKTILTIKDRERFNTVIEHLSRQRWNNKNAASKTIDSSNILTVAHKAAAFRDIVLTYGSRDFTPEEQKLFLRLYVIIGDILTDSLYDTFACYQQEHAEVYGNGAGFGSMKKFTFARKQGSLKDIEKTADAALRRFSWRHREEEVARHFEVYSKEECWQALPIEYYRRAGIVTTNQEIAELATIERIEQLAAKVRVHVRPYEVEDDPYFD